MQPSAASLQIQIHKINGSVDRFTQTEPGLIKQILNEFEPARIFSGQTIALSDGGSLTALPSHQVVRIDLLAEPSSLWSLPSGIVGALELGKVEFEALRHNPELTDQWRQAQTSGGSFIVFFEVEMVAPPPLFLVLETAGDLFADPEEAINELLTAPTLGYRLRNGGVAVLNLRHLLRLTRFPAPHPPPLRAWPAVPAGEPPSPHPVQAVRPSPDDRRLPPSFLPGGPTPLNPSRKGQNDENTSIVERES